MADETTEAVVAEREVIAPAVPQQMRGQIFVDENRKQSKPWQFQPGVSGNPAGRAVGSRNKLGEDFLATLYADWKANGAAAIVAMRQSDPAAYVKVVASLLPRELDVSVRPELPKALGEMTDGDWELALGIRVVKREG